jgi:hypothetical protein
MPGSFKGTVLRENQMGDSILAYEEELLFSVFVKKNALCLYGEDAKRIKKY